MPAGELTDLDNPAAPGGSTLVTVSAAAFKLWMTRCGFTEGTGNPHQEVFFIQSRPTVTIGTKVVTPNWHITAMTTLRNGGDCINFHFKVEIGKAASHYWHYVANRHGLNFVWVGHPNPLLATTNQGGGGAASNAVALAANRESTRRVAVLHDLDNKVTKSTQAQMMRTLRKLVTDGRLTFAANRVDTP
jgi:hypothetical protein